MPAITPLFSSNMGIPQVNYSSTSSSAYAHQRTRTLTASSIPSTLTTNSDTATLTTGAADFDHPRSSVDSNSSTLTAFSTIPSALISSYSRSGRTRVDTAELAAQGIFSFKRLVRASSLTFLSGFIVLCVENYREANGKHEPRLHDIGSVLICVGIFGALAAIIRHIEAKKQASLQRSV